MDVKCTLPKLHLFALTQHNTFNLLILARATKIPLKTHLKRKFKLNLTGLKFLIDFILKTSTEAINSSFLT